MLRNFNVKPRHNIIFSPRTRSKYTNVGRIFAGNHRQRDEVCFALTSSDSMKWLRDSCHYLSFVTMPARPSTRAWTSLSVVCCCSHSSDSLSVQLIFTTSSCTSFCAACSSSWSGCVGSVCFSSLWISSSYRGIFCTGLISNWSSPSLPLCSRSIA